MITDTKDGQTNYCPNCEDQARRIEELERRERMLVDALKVAKSYMPEMSCFPPTSRDIAIINDAINTTPSHSAAPKGA